MRGQLRRAVVAAALVGSPTVLAAQVVTVTNQSVSGQANIYAAGLPTVPALQGGGGVLPAASGAFTAGAGRVLTFSSVTGGVSCADNNPTNPPDGGGCAGALTSVSSLGGISGIVANGRTNFLVGVFLAGAQPATAPSALTFGGGGIDFGFTTLSPAIGQVFFIGDGRTGTGTGAIQQFLVPSTATQLYLGIADAASFQGAPGFYGDNTGAFTASYSISAAVSSVPEPSTYALLGTGLLAVGGAAARRKRTTV